jgi:hypothetical protein
MTQITATCLFLIGQLVYFKLAICPYGVSTRGMSGHSTHVELKHDTRRQHMSLYNWSICRLLIGREGKYKVATCPSMIGKIMLKKLSHMENRNFPRV